MKLYLKNKIISIGNGSSIKDQHGKDFYKVKGKAFSHRKKKYLCDLEGKTLYRIQNKWFNFLKHTAYIFDADGKKVATVVKRAFTIGRYLVYDADGSYEITGKVLSRMMDITKDGELYAKIGREFDIFRDSYFVEASDENMIFALALVIAIDNIIDNIQDEDR